MPETSKNCDVVQGYNFQQDAQTTIGFITALNIGGTDIAADQACKDPIEYDEMKVVGVLSGVHWQGGKSNPLNFSCQVSTSNKTLIKSMLAGQLKKTDVTMKFIVYDYDLDNKTYYQSFHSGDETLNALINKAGGKLSIQVADNASHEVVSPANYSLNMAIMPQDQAQVIHEAFSQSAKHAAEWGVKVGA
jgi:hypothetical protein